MNSNKSILELDKEINELDAKPGQKLRLYIMLNIADNLRWMNSHLSKMTNPPQPANPNSSNGSEITGTIETGSHETGVGASDSPMQNKEVAESISNILDQVGDFHSEIDDLRREFEDNDHEHDQYASYDDLTNLEDTVNQMKEDLKHPQTVEISWS